MLSAAPKWALNLDPKCQYVIQTPASVSLEVPVNLLAVHPNVNLPIFPPSTFPI